MNPSILALIALTGCWSSPPGDLPAGDADTPDIVFVSIDTLRADHLSSYGYARQTSPFLDQLAADGVRYAHARSASPWTLPAHTTMFTGQLPATHRVVDDNLALSTDVPVLPTLLQQAGYKTAGLVSTLYVSRKFGFERGFDYFNDFGINTEKENLHGDLKASDVVDDALRWWSKQDQGEPVFLFLHFYDVHYTYDPPAPYDAMFDRPPQKGDQRYKNYFYFKRNPLDEAQMTHQIAQYDEAIRYVDDQLKRIADASEKAGRQIRWVVTSDHGEEFGERGSWGHAHTLYTEQLHVPLIVSGPGIPADTVLEKPVGNHDFAPTIASWAGVADQLEADGIDLNPSFEGGDAVLPERAFLAETTRFKTNRLSLLHKGLRLEWDLHANKAELYNPTLDPDEQIDLSKRMYPMRAEMQRKAIELLGVDWQATQAGALTLGTRAFVLSADGRQRSAQITPHDCFLVLPYDADVTFTPAEGPKQGPWRSVGGQTPGDGQGLVLLRETLADTQALTEEDKQKLIAIGYMQEDDEGGITAASIQPVEALPGNLRKCAPLP
ncbi:MAG: sulfatase [Myxococcota bacterium]